MSTQSAILLFGASLGLSAVSSLVLATSIDRVGHRLGLSEGLLGAVTALGADAPEIATAVTAVARGRHDIGVGVVLGSNIFNITVLLGVSAMVSGRVSIRPRALLFNGAVGLVASGLAAGLTLQALTPSVTLVLLLAVFAPYIALLAVGADRIRRRTGAGVVRRVLASAMAEEEREGRQPQQPRRATSFEVLAIVPALTTVVLASVELVNTAETLGDRWQIPGVVIGAVVLAGLTGLPNLIAAVRLARRQRGSAVVTETLNSNSINVLVGLCVPALIVGFGAPGAAVPIEAAWLVGVSALGLGLAGTRGGLRRAEGGLLLALYVAFVVLLAS